MSSADGPLLVREATLDAAFQVAGAERWGVPYGVFVEAIERAVRSRFASGAPDPATVDAFVTALHLPDVALACACGQGTPEAWDHFVLTFRPELYRAARAIAGEAGSRELADSLYAELFGLPGPGGERRSLFRYYHGRSKLATWLRSVLAQRHVDAVRAARRLSSLDDPEHPVELQVAAGTALLPDQARHMRAAAEAVTAALGTLEAPDRLRLAYYYVHELTLAEIGRLLGEHEATASRKLERARRALRERIEAGLAGHGLTATDIDDWAAVARDAWDAVLADALAVPAPGRSPSPATARGAGAAQAGELRPFKGKRTP
jgi:RNA polymerase sigma-70 factor (ECF subfamily)